MQLVCLSAETCWLQIDNSFGQIKPFTFNTAFGDKTSQEEMFEGCGIKHLVEMAVEGLVSNGFFFYYKICKSTLLSSVSSIAILFYEGHSSFPKDAKW